MADLRIIDAPEIPTNSITGQEKLPTGGSGNYSISLDSLADYTKTKKDLADKTYVDNKVGGVRQELNTHIEDLANPHQVTKVQIGLGNVDNTADADKPVSNSTQAAIISAVTPKADKTYVDNSLSSKSDKTYVDNHLTLKANKVDVYTKAETYTKQESSDLVSSSISTALTPVNTSLDLAKRGVANRYDPLLTYNSGERAILSNGDIVKSTIDGNTNDPNLDMTGWIKTKLNIVATSQFSNIVTAEQYAYENNQSLLVDSSQVLSGSLNIRVDVEILKGSVVNHAGHNLIFDKNITAGRYQIFSGTGNVTAFKCEEAFSDWFGAVADGYTYSIDNVNTANNTYTVNGTSYAFGVSPTVTYTDATAALQKTIDLGAKKTVITDSGNGIYMIDTQNWLQFVGKFKRELVLDGQLKAIPTNAMYGCVLLIQDVFKCKVTAKSKVVGNLLEHDLLNSSEYIHGYHIANAVDCDFIDLETEFHVGDGSYVAYVRAGDWLDTSKYTKNICFNGGSHNYNRRTGHVIEIGNHIYHKNVNYDNNGTIRGTGTWSGVDVEPFGSDETKVRYADHIYFDECSARGNTKGGGIRFERVYNGGIRNCVLSKNGNGVELHRCGIVSEWSVSNKQVLVKNKGYIHVHGNHFEDNNFGFICAYGLSQFNLHDNTFVNCKEADMVIRAINSNIHDNITNMSQGTELIHLINSNYERNKSIDFYPARDNGTARLAIGTVQNYNHPAFELTGDVLVNTRVTFGGSGYTYENIVINVSGSSSGDNAKVYPIITGGVLTALQILHHGSGYNNGCTITVTGGVSNAEVKTFCESLSSTSRIERNQWKLSSKIDTSVGTTYSSLFGIIQNGNPILRDNYFDPRLSFRKLVTGSRSTARNIITIADNSVSQKLDVGTLVQDNGLKVVTATGSLNPAGELWGGNRAVKLGYTTQTSTGNTYMCIQDGTTGSVEISGESEYVTDGTAAWAFLFKAPTLQAVSFA